MSSPDERFQHNSPNPHLTGRPDYNLRRTTLASRSLKRPAPDLLENQRTTCTNAETCGLHDMRDDESSLPREPQDKVAKGNGIGEVTRGILRRASHSMRPASRQYHLRTRKDSPIDAADSLASSGSEQDSRGKQNGFLSQFRRRRGAVAGPSGSEGRWNPVPAPQPTFAPPVVIPLHPSSGRAARAAAAAAQNNRLPSIALHAHNHIGEQVKKDSESAIYMDSQTSFFDDATTLMDDDVPLIQRSK